VRCTTKTVQSYTELLETVFLVRRIKAWRANIGSREVTTPKIYVVDSGLLVFLLGADERRASSDDQVTGKLFENFVAMEIARLVDCAETSATQYHYRDRSSGDEIDVVLESRAGQLVCVECKAAATVRPEDYRAIAKLRAARRDQFVAGVVIYTGDETKALTEKIWAVRSVHSGVPMTLWSQRSSRRRRRRRWRCTIDAALLDLVDEGKPP